MALAAQAYNLKRAINVLGARRMIELLAQKLRASGFLCLKGPETLRWTTWLESVLIRRARD
jgi:hypothetical protein